MKKVLPLIFISFLGFNKSFAQLAIDTTPPPAALVNAITAGGIAVSNISFTGVQHAGGSFVCPGACNLGISGGIILTSGYAPLAAAPNTGTGQGYDNGLVGEPDLATLTNGTIADAVVLEFDFIAVSDTAIFNYVFASEEYSDYVGSAFNDVFGFFISGPGITGNQNIALVPGTSTPIAINNVNNGYSGSGTPPSGPCTNCAYFLDNTLNAYTTAYDGLTTILTATAAGIQPGQTYHLKLAVSDVADHIFDTGVFLEAGSFRIAGPPAMYIGGNKITGNNNTVHICQGSSVSLSVPAGFSYLWSTGETTQSIIVNTAGTYNVTITGSNANYTVVSPFITFIVDNTTIPAPVLTFANNTISSSVNSASYMYSWTFNGMPVPGIITPDIIVSQSGCYAVTVQDPGGCYVTSDTLCVIPLGINEINTSSSIRLYPNPCNESCRLIFDNPQKNTFTLKILDVTGRAVRGIQNIVSDHVLIGKETLNQGVYFYELMNATKNEVFVGKIVVN